MNDKRVALEYPEIYRKPFGGLVVGLMHTRAADDLRLSYDGNRDGWVIEQAQVFRWACDGKVCDPKWKEVAFIPAWGSRIKCPSEADNTIECDREDCPVCYPKNASSAPSQPEIIDYVDRLPASPVDAEVANHLMEQLREISAAMAIPMFLYRIERGEDGKPRRRLVQI